MRPPGLRGGDRVAVVAPSGPVDPARLERGCSLLRSFGLDVSLGSRLRSATRQPAHHAYLAGSDTDRARDLQDAWLDPDVAAVACARGGYGATRLLDRFDWKALAAAEPKVLLGSSDATALHTAFGFRLGLVTLFGPMVAADVLSGAAADETTVRALRCSLFAPETATVLTGASVTMLAPGTATGVLVGGTLSLLAAVAGTPYEHPADGGIAVLEDVNEAPYRLDRYLTQLLQAGWFDGVRGIALGSWVGCGSGPGAALDVLAERLGPLGVPLLAGLPVGHGTPQLTVPLGARATLDAAAGTLTLTEPGLA